MSQFTINNEMIQNKHVPSFSLSLDSSQTTVIYSDADMQAALVKSLQNSAKLTVFDQQDGLYDRLTVEENMRFFHKWFHSPTPVVEIIVLFELQSCATKKLEACSVSEIRRIHFAKYFMSLSDPVVFLEPIQGVDIKTMNTFIKMLEQLKTNDIPVLLLVSNIEHALLLGDAAYKLQRNGIQEIEVDEAEEPASENKQTTESSTVKLFKVPAKVDDKVILFDPPEIDYIESQDGKVMIVVNEETFALNSTLTEIEKKLEVYGFYRCHRSYIVNLQKVREIITWSKNTYSLKINNNTQSTIPLSRTKIQDIQEKFSLE